MKILIILIALISKQALNPKSQTWVTGLFGHYLGQLDIRLIRVILKLEVANV